MTICPCWRYGGKKMVAFAFLVLLGVPFAAGIAAGSLRGRRYVRVGIAAAFPTAVALVVFLGRPYSLIDVGVGFIAAVVVFGWLLGFGLSSDVHRLVHLIGRSLRHLIAA
jgi:hypothetical protein